MHLNRDFVDATLRTFLKTSTFLNNLVGAQTYATMPYVVWKGEFEGREVFTLGSRRPSVLRTLPVVRHLVEWFDPQVTDPRPNEPQAADRRQDEPLSQAVVD
jgi:hypothetical protein